MAVIAVFIMEIGLSLVALFLGAHIALFTAKGIPTLSPRFLKKYLDPLVTIVALLAWVATICLVVWMLDVPQRQ